MEAPEKIYLHIRANNEIGSTWHGDKITNKDIEYIRKDAFIEKACNWLLNNIRQYSTNALGAEYLIEDFKNYMKGE